MLGDFDYLSVVVCRSAVCGTVWILLSSAYLSRIKTGLAQRFCPKSSPTALFYANFFLTAVCACCFVAYRLRIPFVSVVAVVIRYVFRGDKARHCLLAFWLLCLVFSLTFLILAQSVPKCRIGTEHRKFFHLTVSLVAVSGLQIDPQLTLFAVVLVGCAFACVECARCLHIAPLDKWINNVSVVFLDEQDSTSLILTPFYLLIGTFMPLFLSPVALASQVKFKHFAGVWTVGIGDSAAAIGGRRFGRIGYGLGSRKTVEGSMCLLLAQVVTVPIFAHLLRLPICFFSSSFLYFVFVSFICAVVEAMCTSMDNIILPLVAYCLL